MRDASRTRIRVRSDGRAVVDRSSAKIPACETSGTALDAVLTIVCPTSVRMPASSPSHRLRALLGSGVLFSSSVRRSGGRRTRCAFRPRRESRERASGSREWLPRIGSSDGPRSSSRRSRWSSRRNPSQRLPSRTSVSGRRGEGVPHGRSAPEIACGRATKDSTGRAREGRSDEEVRRRQPMLESTHPCVAGRTVTRLVETTSGSCASRSVSHLLTRSIATNLRDLRAEKKLLHRTDPRRALRSVEKRGASHRLATVALAHQARSGWMNATRRSDGRNPARS